MKLLGYSARTCGLVSISLTVLLLGLVQPTISSPFGLLGVVDTPTELEPSLYNLTFSAHAPNQRHKREGEPKGIRFEATCSPALQHYLLLSFGEARTQAERAEIALNDLIQILKEKTQPADWSPHRYTTLYRNLKLWGNFFGLPKLKKNEGQLSIKKTINTMVFVRDMFNTIKKGLENSGKNFDLIVNCNDEWLVYEKDRISKKGTTYRMYKDTREKHKGKSVYVQTPARKMTCKEHDTSRARTWSEDIGLQDELIICPFAWNKWLGDPPPYLSDFAGTPFSRIKGKTLDTLKYRAAGSTLLHEAFHAINLVNYDIGDQAVRHGEVTKGAYGAELVQVLARNDPDNVLKNADSYAMFALGVYYNQCNWANAMGKCLDDNPDTICPEDEKTKKRNCITIDWN